MILDGENGQLLVAQSFNRAVIQINMGDFQRSRQTIRIHRIAVILGGDISAAGSQILSPDDFRPGDRISI